MSVPVPRQKDEQARTFYGLTLGLRELTRSSSLSRNGGIAYALPDGRELLLETADDFRPLRRARLTLVVTDLEAVADTLGKAGYRTEWDFNGEPLRFYCEDPFGNRLEFANGEV